MTKIICLKIIFPNVINSKEFRYPSNVFLSIYDLYHILSGQERVYYVHTQHMNCIVNNWVGVD